MTKKRKKRRSTLRRQATQTREARPSRRERMARARKQKQRRRQLITALIVAAAVVVIAFLIWLNTRPLPLVTVAAEIPANADGAAWGPPNAPVVVQDWSDFG